MVVITWNQTYQNYNYLVAQNDWYSMAVLLDSNASTITDKGNCTNVQFGFHHNASVTNGTLTCCRWADMTAYTQSSATALLAAAEHTYWSTDTDIATGMSSETVTESTPLAENCVIGYVITGVTPTTNGVTGRFYENFTTNYSPKRSSSGSTGAYSSTPEFTISVESEPGPTSSGTLLPPPPAMVRL